MKKIILSLFVLCSSVFAQSAPVTPTVVKSPVSSTSTYILPSIVFGAGPSWDRGGQYVFATDMTFGLRIGTTNWYSWTTVSTPVTTTNVPGSPPVASTLTTGGAWVAAQNATGTVSLVTIVQAGFSAVQANSTVAPAFNGSIGVAFKVANNLYVLPYVKGSNATTSTNGSALATAVLQPGIQIMYGFGSK